MARRDEADREKLATTGTFHEYYVEKSKTLAVRSDTKYIHEKAPDDAS